MDGYIISKFKKVGLTLVVTTCLVSTGYPQENNLRNSVFQGTKLVERIDTYYIHPRGKTKEPRYTDISFDYDKEKGQIQFGIYGKNWNNELSNVTDTKEIRDILDIACNDIAPSDIYLFLNKKVKITNMDQIAYFMGYERASAGKINWKQKKEYLINPEENETAMFFESLMQNADKVIGLLGQDFTSQVVKMLIEGAKEESETQEQREKQKIESIEDILGRDCLGIKLPWYQTTSFVKLEPQAAREYIIEIESADKDTSAFLIYYLNIRWPNIAPSQIKNHRGIIQFVIPKK